jgi:Tol biopolymer transport system component
VAFATKKGKYCWQQIWLMGPDGKHAQKLYDAEAGTDFCGAEWSPDGQRLAYVRGQPAADAFDMSVESRDLKGGRANMIVPAPNRLQDFCWSPDRRVMYSLAEPDPNGMSCNLWAMRVDGRTGKPREQPRRLTNWAGFRMDNLSATADGKRLAFRKWSWQGSVYVADLEADGKRITTPRRLTLSESRSYPTGWTANSKAVLFQSNRGGKWGIFMQSLDADSARPLTTGPEDVYQPTLSPDGAWILYVLATSELMRVPAVGGVPHSVLKSHIFGYACAKSPAKLCVIGERTPDGKQLIFTAFDPLEGRGRELSRFDIDPEAGYQWDLSPDGLHIAICRRLVARIQILSLSGQKLREISIKGWNGLQNVNWAADGKRLFVSTSIPDGAVLLQVDLHGNTNVIWEQRGSPAPFTAIPFGGPSMPWGVPSPDGRHLAIYCWSLSSNIWMIENF